MATSRVADADARAAAQRAPPAPSADAARSSPRGTSIGGGSDRVERVTWLGHATALLEIGGARLLTDPVLRDRVAHLRRHAASPPAGVADAIDAVLLSHLHRDHADVATLRRLRRDVAVLVPRGGGALLGRLGFTRVSELRAGDGVNVRGAAVTAVPAVHDGRRHPLARPAEAIGFVVAGERRVYFAGDTDVFGAMADLAGTLDAALLPVWGWGPSLGAGHMDPLAAARAVAILRPRVAVPIHWGTFFPAGLARWRGSALVEPPRAFARHVGRLAPSVEVRVLVPGASFALDRP